MAEDLKPCPFCGGVAEIDAHQSYRNITTGAVEQACAVYCLGCGATQSLCYRDVPLDREDCVETVIGMWNRRPTASPEESSAAPTEAVADIEAWALDLQGQLNTAEAAVFLREADISDLRKTLEGVRDDLHNENRLNTESIADVIWHSEIETTVDFIDAALARTAEARSANLWRPGREAIARVILPAAFERLDDGCADREDREEIAGALEVADAILALPTPPKAEAE
jgi:hypothetical protein